MVRPSGEYLDDIVGDEYEIVDQLRGAIAEQEALSHAAQAFLAEAQAERAELDLRRAELEVTRTEAEQLRARCRSGSPSGRPDPMGSPRRTG